LDRAWPNSRGATCTDKFMLQKEIELTYKRKATCHKG
jgi:hypothetical protein